MEHVNTLKLCNDFNDKFLKEQEKLPYHINIIDELHANENAHSRVLLKLLFYIQENTYPILQSLLNYLGGDFQKIKIKLPEISNEKHRIDLLITEKKDYAIIIENKIHGAIDQEEQIKRYITRLKSEGFKQIYLLYLTRNGGEPSKHSFPDELRNSPDITYKPISYRNHILSWLKESILPACRYKDTFLLSAIQQYIDHLEGIFQFRTIEKTMKQSLKTTLLEELGLNENMQKNEKLRLLCKKQKEVFNLQGYLTGLQDDIILELFGNWFNIIKEKYKEYNIIPISNAVNSLKDDDCFYLGIKFYYKNKDNEFLCAIGRDGKDEDDAYYGLTVRGCERDPKKNDVIKKFVNESFSTFNYNISGRWYFWKQAELSNIIDEYFEFIKILLEEPGVEMLNPPK